MPSDQEFPLFDRPAAERFWSLLVAEPAPYPESLSERYQMLRQVGQGGMATVYLARDLRHGREVAVKIMRPDLAASLGRPRFLREIGIAAGLRHPNIVPVFDSGEADGALFYVMPYEAGHSLRDRLALEPRLPLDDALVILRDVSEAVAHAHQQGIVHRDIKPDNVLLSGGRAVVTDFGVARAVSAAADEVVTLVGDRIGTPAYMAPERAGSSPDPRLDVYAFGVMAFELLAGERPFSTGSPLARDAGMDALRTRLAGLRPDLPDGLAEVVARCLAVRAEDRYPDAAAVRSALPTADPSRWGGGRARRMLRASGLVLLVAAVVVAALLLRVRRDPPPVEAPRLAVLMFQAGGRPDLEPLATGLTDQLIGALGSVPGLVVRSLAAVRPYQDSVIPPAELATRLEVTWLVTGRLYPVEDRRVASVELTEAATGRLIARTEASAGTGEDVQLIEAVVNQVAILLREKVGEQLRLQAWRAGTRSDAAYAAVHRAQQERQEAGRLAALRDVPGAWTRLRRADGMLDSAARADPRWSEPWIQRAALALQLAATLYGSGHATDSIPAVLAAGIAHAATGVARDPASPRARELLGLLWYERAHRTPVPDSTPVWEVRAETLLRDVSEADTTLVEGLSVLSSIHFERGEYQQAYLLAERGWRADAFHRDPRELLSRLFSYSFEAEEDVEADRWCRQYQSRFPDDWFGSFCRLTLAAWGTTGHEERESALDLAARGTALAPSVIRPVVSAQLHTVAAGALARAGRAGDARRVLGEVRTALAVNPATAREPFGTDLLRMEAEVRLLLGERDSARALLRRYLDRRPDRDQALRSGRRLRGLLPDDAVRPNTP